MEPWRTERTLARTIRVIRGWTGHLIMTGTGLAAQPRRSNQLSRCPARFDLSSRASTTYVVLGYVFLQHREVMKLFIDGGAHE